ncbi:MAG: methyl-accepting chemotaxis protein [Rhodocyclaceae bacterium]
MTLRNRLILVLAVLAVATVVANGFSLLMFSRLGDAATSNLEEAKKWSRAIYVGAGANRHMLLQEHALKDALLRTSDPSARRKYLSEFEAEAGEVRKYLGELEQLAPALGLKPEPIARVVSSHAALTERYRGALRDFEARRPGAQAIERLLEAGDAQAGEVSVHESMNALRKAIANQSMERTDQAIAFTGQTVRNAGWSMVAIVAVSAIGGLLAFVLFARALLRILGGEPQYAAQVVKRVATGDLAFEVKRHAGDGESLIAAIAGMQAQLREMVAQIRAAATHLGESATQFSNMTASLSAGSATQNEAAAQAAAAVAEMSASIEKVAESAGEVDRQSAASLEKTREGNESLSSMVGELDEVKSAVGDVALAAEAFIGSAQAIMAMTRQVRDIADQTNLLALNAAIEAARAGEQGRGFAVVADEVRKLAEKSAVAASEIDKVTQSLAEKSGKVEGAIQHGKAALESSENYLNRMGEVLGAANGEVSHTRAGMSEISSSVREQTIASNGIARNVERIARMAGENSAAVERAAEEARRLEELAGNLSEVANRFTV